MTQVDLKKLKSVAKKYDIATLGIFGSYARGTAKPQSDLDLIVKFTSPKSLFELVRIEREMSKATRKKVDLLTENSISPYLKNRIHRETKMIL